MMKLALLLGLTLNIQAIEDFVVHVTRENYEQVIKEAHKPLILDVFAPWCGPCNRMKPLYHKFAYLHQNDYICADINIEDVPEIEFAFNITAFPTLLVFKDTKELGRFTGNPGTYVGLKARIEKLIIDAQEAA